MSIIQVQDVHKEFEAEGKRVVKVLNGISFEVERGETLCILGGSGGGKSTLLKVMIGAHPPTHGDVIIDGDSIAHADSKTLDSIRRRFGVLFQSGALLNSMTVGQNVALPISFHTKLDADTIDIMVKIKLEQVGLLHAKDRLPAEISGGMQKRAGLARAIALEPKVVFYDEPSAGLDPIATTQIDELINQLKDTMGMTNVVVTHVMESVQRIADKVLMLDRGQVILYGTLDDLLNSDNPKIQRFVRGETEGLAAEGSNESFVRDLLM